MLISTKGKICSYDGLSSISSFALCIKLVKYSLKTALCAYQHLLAAPKIWDCQQNKEKKAIQCLYETIIAT